MRMSITVVICHYYCVHMCHYYCYYNYYLFTITAITVFFPG